MTNIKRVDMINYQISGNRIIVVKPHVSGGTTHRELDFEERRLVKLAMELAKQWGKPVYAYYGAEWKDN